MNKYCTYLAVTVSTCFLIGCSTQREIIDVQRYDVAIENLGPAVNSRANDFSPTVTANGTSLYFTSGRQAIEGASHFWVSQMLRGFWAPPIRMGAPFSGEEVIGNPSVSADGQTLYFACKRDDGYGLVDIYSATLHGDTWGGIMNLGSGVNSADWESQPCISPDGNALYFVSDRSGGRGGLDIWMSVRDAAGKWLPAVNIGPAINTGSNEVSPFIAADNMTLYFASDGHPGRAGTDLFVSRRIQGIWSKPENLGLPLNSDENDEFLTLTAAGSTIYFASQRPGGVGGLDIYKAEPNPFPPNAVLVLSGTVKDANSRTALGAALEVRDSRSGQVIASHASNELTGEYVIVLPSGRAYTLSASIPPYIEDSTVFDLTGLMVYEERSHDFLLLRERAATALDVYVGTSVPMTEFSLLEGAEKHAGLLIEEIEAGETVPLLPYIFFGKESAELNERYSQLGAVEAPLFDVTRLPEGVMPKYRQILNIVGMRMVRHPEARLTITASIAEDEGSIGMALAEQRANRIRSYLTSVWNLASERISTNSVKRLPAPSSGSTPEGMDENRRAELNCDDERILSPVITRSVEKSVSPPFAIFYPKVFADNGLRSWEMDVTQSGNKLYVRTGTAGVPDSIMWDWRDESGRLPESATPIRFVLKAVDAEGLEASSAEQEFPVKITTLRKKSQENLPDRTIERINLILFDFDKSALSTRNQAMLAALDKKLTQDSRVSIIGYSDAIGEDQYNRELSQARADHVRAALQRLHPDIPMQAKGIGETDLLFDQTHPEGRFYSRTVIIIIETMKQ